MISASELLITSKGCIYHLNLAPGQVANDIILVGDPGRVQLIKSFLSGIEFESQNREFVCTTGWYNSKRITVISTGIGVGNIDIVLNELDALVNIDFTTREIKDDFQKLNILRLGTSGSLQENIPVGAFVVSQKAIGLDGIVNYLNDRDKVSNSKLEQAFNDFFPEFGNIMKIYAIDGSQHLVDHLSGKNVYGGITLTAPGFFASQGRVVRMPIILPGFNDKVEHFKFEGMRITNYEMETSAIYGYCKILGHHTASICLVVANRSSKTVLNDYEKSMIQLIEHSLTRLSTF